MPTILTQAHVDDVCHYGQGERCCAYLGMGAQGYRCFKEAPELASIISGRLERREMRAKGDYCSGPPEFKRTTEDAPS